VAMGAIKFFNMETGYGFILNDAGGPDVFVARKAFQSTGYLNVVENMRVEFDIVAGPKGPTAANVRVM